jgi:hypothetical protein
MRTYLSRFFLPFFGLFDAFLEVALTRFDGLPLSLDSAGERVHLLVAMRYKWMVMITIV